ncbi:GyrI-like domain-containing protein [Kribbella qitaiheensis]|uniref:GyrI-like domain-containing protein n=1 Tax=Kribbella qitaiheensis TaxID=1544730 RepID=A0A7G6WSK8_9ACTN|nr:GyrI-like domain-containing protein [Kribbella qitaiheensis]QNE16973.1 GyrI-like domain-containing protein [Kribbella qitaiheensis]
MRTAVVEDRTVAAQTTAVRRAVLSPADVSDWLLAAFNEIAESLRGYRIVANGFPFTRRRPLPDGRIEIEAGFPVGVPVRTDGTVQCSELPAGPVAVIAYAGPYDEIDRAYDQLGDWLRLRGVRPSGEAWEIYHDPPIGPPANWRVEIVQPCSSELRVP